MVGMEIVGCLLAATEAGSAVVNEGYVNQNEWVFGLICRKAQVRMRAIVLRQKENALNNEI